MIPAKSNRRGGLGLHLYVEPVLTAALAFPFVAAAITLSYMIVQYRRYGAILLLRTAILYSFVLYLMCAYFLTMLPLPDRATVASLTTPYLQLEPFKDVVKWYQSSGLVLSDPSTWRKAFINRDLFVILANVALTFPLGIYLRYYFNCSLKKTFFITLGVSLVFELTQLSALFGIYPRPYRLCETDDLITNTLGGLIGYWFAKPLMRVLPSRQRMEEIAYKRSAHVSVTRRVTAAIVDWVVIGALTVIVSIFTHPFQRFVIEGSFKSMLTTLGLIYLVQVAAYFILGEWLQRGLTFGKRLTHLRLVDARTGGRPKLWQCFMRYTLLYFVFVPLPVVALLFLYDAMKNEETQWLALTVCILLLLVYAACVIWLVIRVLNRSSELPHGELSKTRNISTLKVRGERRFSDGSVYHRADGRRQRRQPAPPSNRSV